MKRSFCSLSGSHQKARLIGLGTILLLAIWLRLILPVGAEQGEPQRIDISTAAYQELFEELAQQHGFDPHWLVKIFAGLSYDNQVLELMDRQWEAKPYYEYRTLFFTPAMTSRGKELRREHQELFDRLEAAFGVDREYVIAIWGIESRYGTNMGSFSLFRTFNTLFAGYPRRADFFRQELVEYLLLCRANDLDPLAIRGSYAGAFGQAQFMPSSFNAYAVDFDGDGKVDLINSLPDVLASIANYLRHFGWVLDAPVYAELGGELLAEDLINVWKEGWKGRIAWRRLAEVQQVTLPRPPQNKDLSIAGLETSGLLSNSMRFIAGYPNFNAITAYNHSQRYAMAVTEVAQAVASD